jgi:hypothetical protein
MSRTIWLILLFSVGCAGTHGFRPLSTECRERINQCVGQCAPEMSRPPNDARNTYDSRTACERQCDAICNK